MHTTLKQLREVNACTERYTFLRKAIGPKYGDKKPITMTQILDLNGMDDCLWAISHTQNGAGEKLLRLFACDCAEHVLPIFEKKYPKDARPRECIAVARRYANGEASNEERAAARAARDAAGAAAWAAAEAAARAAAGDAAGAAAWAAGAAWAAAWAAARDAAAGDAAAWEAARAAAWAAGDAETKWQVDRLREMLANITR